MPGCVLSSPHVSLSLLRPHRARGTCWSINKSFKEGAAGLDFGWVLKRGQALLLQPGTIWACFLREAQSDPPTLVSLLCFSHSSFCQNQAVPWVQRAD